MGATVNVSMQTVTGMSDSDCFTAMMEAEKLLVLRGEIEYLEGLTYQALVRKRLAPLRQSLRTLLNGEYLDPAFMPVALDGAIQRAISKDLGEHTPGVLLQLKALRHIELENP